MNQLNATLKSLSSSIDTTAINAAITDASNKFLAAKETTLGSNDVGEIKGGTQSLTQELDNLVDKLESTLKPTVAKITETFKGIEADLKPAISDTASVEVLTKVNSEANLNVLGSIVEDTDQIDNFEEMNYDITSDASPEAIAASLKKAIDAAPEKINEGLQKLANTDFGPLVDQAVKDFDVAFGNDGIPKAISQLGTSINTATSALNKRLGGIGSGSLIKDMIEQSNKVVSTSVNSVIRNTSGAAAGTNFEFAKAQSIAGKMLKGDFDLAEAEALSNLTVPTQLKELAELNGIPAPASLTPGNSLDFIQTLEINPLTKDNIDIKEALVGFKDDISKVQKVVKDPTNTTAAAAIKQQDETVPITSAPIVRPENFRNAKGGEIPAGGFGFLNSREEIIKYLQSATREITTVIWHWTANYNDQYHVGAEEVHSYHKERFGFIGYHFIIKRDGQLQLGLDINRQGAHVAGFNDRSIGISFVAGYNCASGTKNPNKYISSKSITEAQMRCFKAFMESFYTVFPGGQAWGHADFPNNKGKVDPGFDVQAAVKTMFGKVNIGHPKIDNHILTTAEIKASKQTAIA